MHDISFLIHSLEQNHVAVGLKDFLGTLILAQAAGKYAMIETEKGVMLTWVQRLSLHAA
jgi:hypothetical protein